MNIQEFTNRTGFYPSLEMYAIIEKHYNDMSVDKDTFCKAYKENVDGLAEKIQQDAAMTAINNQSRAVAAANKLQLEKDELMEQVKRLTEQLDKEQNWHPYGHNSELEDDSYHSLTQSGRELSDADAVELIASEFGFMPDKIEIVHTLKIYEINRHQLLRKTGEIIRLPYYGATDWNYIRFNVNTKSGSQWYEMINGELRLFND